MPVKRRVTKTRSHLVTPAAVEAFDAGDAPGLHEALGLKPWEVSPLDAEGRGRPAYPVHGWEQAVELAAELRAAIEPRGRV